MPEIDRPENTEFSSTETSYEIDTPFNPDSSVDTIVSNQIDRVQGNLTATELVREKNEYLDLVSNNRSLSSFIPKKLGSNYQGSSFVEPQRFTTYKDSFDRQPLAKTKLYTNALDRNSNGLIEVGNSIYALNNIATVDGRSFAGDRGFNFSPSPTIDLLTAAEKISHSDNNLSLVNKFKDLQSKLGQGAINKVTERVYNGQVTGVDVTVNVGVTDFNRITDPTGKRSTKTFSFTADAHSNAIELSSNRYINGALLHNVTKVDRLSGLDTAVGLVAGYVRETSIVDFLAVNKAYAGVVEKGEIGVIDKVFGAAVSAQMGQDNVLSFSQLAAQTDPNFLRTSLKDAITRLSIVESNPLDKLAVTKLENAGVNRNAAELEIARQRTNLLTKALGGIINKSGPISSDTIVNALINLQDTLLAQGELQLTATDTVSIGLFTSLKSSVVGGSNYGKNIFRQTRINERSRVLETLTSGFLQPHETGFTGAQGQARLGLYENKSPLLSSFNDVNFHADVFFLRPALYSHSNLKVVPGSAYVPIASQVNSNREAAAAMFDTEKLFSGVQELGSTTLSQFKSTLKQFNYAHSDSLVDDYRKSLGLDSKDDENIFLLPFKKAQQISQRLKNVVGARATNEYSLELHKAVLGQDVRAINKFYNQETLSLDRSKALAGTLGSALPAMQFAVLKSTQQSEAVLMAQESGGKYTVDDVLQDQTLKLQLSERVTNRLRTIEADPFSLRGLVSSKAQKRVGIVSGMNQMSDFMRVNESFKSVFGYEQLSKIDLPELIATHRIDGTDYRQSIDFEKQKNLLTEVFTKGNVIYYGEQSLVDTNQLTELTNKFNQYSNEYRTSGDFNISSGTEKAQLQSLTNLAQQKLLHTNDYISSVTTTDVSIDPLTTNVVSKFQGEIVDGRDSPLMLTVAAPYPTRKETTFLNPSRKPFYRPILKGDKAIKPSGNPFIRPVPNTFKSTGIIFKFGGAFVPSNPIPKTPKNIFKPSLPSKVIGSFPAYKGMYDKVIGNFSAYDRQSTPLNPLPIRQPVITEVYAAPQQILNPQEPLIRTSTITKTTTTNVNGVLTTSVVTETIQGTLAELETRTQKPLTMEVTLMPGVYKPSETGLTNVGILEDGQVRIGLHAQSDSQGNQTESRYTKIKLPGAITDIRGGVAIINNTFNVLATASSTFEGTLSTTILTSDLVSGMRPATDIKGPFLITTRNVFDYLAEVQGDLLSYSTDTEQQPIFALANVNAIKGYNYKSGLDSLRGAKSYDRVLSILNTDRAAVSLATMFLDDNSSPEQADRLRQSLIKYLDTSTSSTDRLLKKNLQLSSSKFGFETQGNLLLNAPAFAALADQTTYVGKDGNPLKGRQLIYAQIQSNFAKAFETNNFDEINKAVKSIFELARSDDHSVEELRMINGEVESFRTFNEGSSISRSAAIIADLLVTIQQAENYSKRREQFQTGPMLEIDLYDKTTNTLKLDSVLGKNATGAVLDMLERAGFQTTSSSTLAHLQKLYQSGNLTELQKNEDFRKLETNLLGLYHNSQAAIITQVSIDVQPSRVLVPAGSENKTALEAHYALNLSTRALFDLRGHVGDITDLTHVQAAYSILTNYSQSLKFSKLNIISPFNSESTSDRLNLLHKLTLSHSDISSQAFLGRDKNESLLHQTIQSISKGDMAKAESNIELMATVKSIAVRNLGSVTSDMLSSRAEAVAKFLDPRRIKPDSKTKKLTDISKGDKIFLDIETSDLIDRNRTESDRLRYPTKITELAFVVEKESGGIIKKSFLIEPGKNTLDEALKELTSHLNKDTTIIGHNIRKFDIPTLDLALEATGNKNRLKDYKLIDTALDIDVAKTKRALGGIKSISLSKIFKSVVKSYLSAAAQMGNKKAAQRLESGKYGKYKAHVATADVDANRALYKYLEKNELFVGKYASKSVQDAYRLTKASQLKTHKLTDRSYIYFGENKELIAKLTMDVISDSKGLSAIHQFEANRKKYTNEYAQNGKVNPALLRDHVRAALDLSTNRIGLIKNSDAGTIYEQVIGSIEKHDRDVESKIKGTLTGGSKAVISTMEEMAAGFLHISRTSTDVEMKTAAQQYYADIMETKMQLMPDITITNDNDGTRKLALVNQSEIVGVKSTTKTNFSGAGIPILGLDVLNAIPTEFKDHESALVKTQLEIRQLLPEYLKITNELGKSGSIPFTESQYQTIEKMSELAAKSRDEIVNASNSLLGQQAYGERHAFKGASSIAVSSYLLGIDEAAAGSRFYGSELDITRRKIQDYAGKSSFDTIKVLNKLYKNLYSFSDDRGYKFVVKDKGKLRQVTIHSEKLDRYLHPTREGNAYKATANIREHIKYLKGTHDMHDLKPVFDALQNPSKVSDLSEGHLKIYEGLISKLNDKKFVQESRRIETKIQKFKNSQGRVELPERNDSRRSTVRGLNIFLNSQDVPAQELNRTMAEYAALQEAVPDAAYINRAGGPAAASIVDMRHSLISSNTLADRGQQQNTYLGFSQQNNQTLLAVASYGRFGSQGGDFDGDAYSVMFGYQNQQDIVAKQIMERDRLEKDRRSINSEINSYRTFPEGYVEARQNEWQQIGDKISDLQIKIDDNLSKLPSMKESQKDFVRRAQDGLRLHTATYLGLSPALLSNDAGLFTLPEVVNLNTQQSGTQPGFSAYKESDALNGARVGLIFQSIVDHEDFTKHLESSDSLKSFVDTYLAKRPDILPDDALKASSAFENIDIDSFRGLSKLEQKGVLIQDVAEIAAFASVLEGYSSRAANASGSALSNDTFHTLQSVIGTTGTSLIGEGYNAITSLIPQAIIARSFSENLGKGPGGIASGLEATSRQGFSERTISHIKDMFGKEADKAEVREFLIDALSDQHVNKLQEAASTRARVITQQLGDIQQIVRDSLKSKESGGMLDAIKKLDGITGESFQQKFLNPDNTEEGRYNLLRDFISGPAGESIFRSQKAEGQYSINAFGAVLLLSDYVKAEDSSTFDEMVYGDKNRYKFLSGRQQFFDDQIAHMENSGETDSYEYKKYKRVQEGGNEALVAQTVLDLINITSTQFALDAKYGDTGSVELVQKFKRGLIGALTTDNPEFDGVRAEINANRNYRSAYLKAYEISETGEDLSTEELTPEKARGIMYEGMMADKEHQGLTLEDINQMRQASVATREMRYNSQGVVDNFNAFTQAHEQNSIALEKIMARGQSFGDPAHAAMLQYTVSENYNEGISQTVTNLESQYGNLNRALEDKDVRRAFRGMAEVSGLFSRLEIEGRSLNPDDQRSAEHMLVMSMAQRGEDGKNGFDILAERSAGMRIIQESQERIYQAKLDSSVAPEYVEVNKAYQDALAQQRREVGEGKTSSVVEETIRLIGATQRQKRKMMGPVIADYTERVNDSVEMTKANKRSSLISILGAPLALTILNSKAEFNDNLIMRSYDLAQGAAQVIKMNGRVSAAAMFQSSRIRDSMRSQDSIIFSGAKSVASELMFEAISRSTHTILRTQTTKGMKGNALMGIAEVLGAVTGLMAAEMMSGRTYGAREEPKNDYIQQMLMSAAESAANYVDAAVEELEAQFEIDTEDGIVNYTFDPSTKPSDFNNRVDTGWLELEIENSEGMSSEVTSDLAAANTPIRT